MQINKIENDTTFGYNPKLNAQVVEKLSKSKLNQPYCNTLLKINEITNQTEIELRKAEKAKNKALVSKLEDAFIVLKSYLASCIEQIYPGLNYSSIEAVTYLKEFSEKRMKNVNHWGYNIMNILNDYAVNEERTMPGSIIRDTQGRFFLCDEEGNALKEMTEDELPPEILEHIRKTEASENAGEVSLVEGSAQEAGKLYGRSNDGKIYELDNNMQPIKEVKMEELPEQVRAKFAEDSDDDEKPISKLVETFVPNEKEKLGFAGLVGLTDLKQKLTRKIVNMLKYPEQAKIDAQEYGKKVPKGILLYGAPGCGKTSIAKALSVEAGLPLLVMKSGQFSDGVYHQTSKNVLRIYKYARTLATPEKPILVFFDDCDSVFAARSNKMERFESEEVNTLLSAIEEASNHNVITIAATNRYDMLDQAVKGRLGMQVELPLPDLETRKALLKFYMEPLTRCQKLMKNEEEIEQLAKKLEGFSIRDYAQMVDDATDKALYDENGRRDVLMQDFLDVIETPTFQNKKIDMKLYETKNTRKSVGFM